MTIDIVRPELEEPKEEYFGNDPTDIEAEDVGQATDFGKPWDPNKIRITTKPFSLRQIVDMIADGDLDLAPDFQRLFVWNAIQRSRLIESILLGIPLPAFYFNQDATGIMQVVDGVQRLTTIKRFASDNEPIVNLEYLKQLEGATFSRLDQDSRVLKRRFQQTQIFANIIEPQTPDDVKFDVFRRINTGGSSLTGQEIRHCMSRTRSRDFLKDLTSMDVFHQATADSFRNERRMADREVALRFCAFRHPFNLDEYKRFGGLDLFLLNFSRRVDGVTRAIGDVLSDEDLLRLKKDFERAMLGASLVFGSKAFRKPSRPQRRGPINRALFESWAVALADYEPDLLAMQRQRITNDFHDRLNRRDYFSAVSESTGDPSKIQLRFQTARDILKRALT